MDADLRVLDPFYNVPYPSDLRLDERGYPHVEGWPVPPANPFVPPAKAIASARAGFPTTAVAYFRFDAALAPRNPDDWLAIGAQAPVLLIDIDPDSPERGRLMSHRRRYAAQAGTPPFDSGGRFVYGADGVPVVQREEEGPVALTLPRAPMPDNGYPLIMYFHGTGGLATQVVDRGPTVEPGGEPLAGLGPSYVLAAHGFATASSASRWARHARMGPEALER